MFDKAAFCPKCGAKRVRAEQEATDVRCPGCATALRRTAVGATILLECPDCDGVWVDADVFERLCADRESQAAVLHRFPDAAPVRAGRVRYRPCARCGKMMNRVNFGRISGTVVDVCRGHGTYLDPGELHRIVEFIAAGGLERARRKQLEELREQDRRLREAQTRLARNQRTALPQPGATRWDVWTLLIGGD